jgi:hypothetical protein
MSIESPVGTLDIKNATLRVGRLEVSNIQGVDTALNVTRANSILIYDDQASTTTFTGFTSTPGVRDTVGGYLDVAGGYVYWGQKLPNAWTMEFEMDIRSGTNAGPLYANVFSTTNTGGDGYSFVYNDSNDKITLMYDGAVLTETSVPGLFTASENWQKVVINYERGMIAISLGGQRKFYYKDIERETPYTTGEYVNFSSSSTDGRKIRAFKVTNGDKWTYSGESNITYTHGSLGIGVVDPTATLDVAGTVNATAFVGDGSAITNINSGNIGDFASNVERIASLETDLTSNTARIESLETDLTSNVGRIASLETDLTSNTARIESLETDLTSNVGRIASLETDLTSNTARIVSLETSNVNIWSNLASNVVRIVSLESGDMTISGDKTFADNVFVTTLADTYNTYLPMVNTDGKLIRSPVYVSDSGKYVISASEAEFLGNITLSGNTTVVSSSSVTIEDRIFGIGSNNSLTNLDSGIIIEHQDLGVYANVALIHHADEHRFSLGYTQNTFTDDHILHYDHPDNVVLTVDLLGDVLVQNNLQVGVTDLFVDTTTSNVGIGTTTPGYKLDVHGTSNVGALTATSLSVAADADNTGIIGTAKVGYVGYSDAAGFAHYDFASAGNYAVLQGASGNTHINTPTGQIIKFRENNVDKMVLSGGNLGIGVTPSTYKLDVGDTAPYISVTDTRTSSGGVSGLDLGGIVFRTKDATDPVPETGDFLGKIQMTATNTESFPDGSMNFFVSNRGDLLTTPSITIEGVSGNVGVGTASPAYTLDVAGKSRLGTVVLNPQTYLMSNVHYIEYSSSTNTTFNQVLLQFDKTGTGTTNQAEYAGYVDCEIVAQRTVSLYVGPEIFTARVNFIAGYNDQDDVWKFTTFVQENKSVSGGVASTFSILQSIPVFKYKYNGTQLQLYVSFNAKQIRAATSFTARITGDGGHINDVSLPDPDALMGTGTDGTAELGICYGVGANASNVGIGTTNPTSNLHVAGNAYVTSNLTVGTANLHVDTTTGNVGIGTASPEYALHINLDSETGSSNTVALIIQNQSSDYTQIENGFGSRIRFETNRGYDSATQTLPSAEIKGYIYDGAGDTGDYHALDLDVYGDNISLNRGISILSKSFLGGPADTIMHGNVGIGTTNPTSNLHVAGNAYVTSNLTVGTANLHVDTTTGFVGVGTTNPQGILHILDQNMANATELLRLEKGGGTGDIDDTSFGHIGMYLVDANEGGGEVARISYGHNGGAGVAPEGKGQLGFWTSNTGGTDAVPEERMTIRANGNVGIGTTDPGYKLDIHGTSNVGALTATTGAFSGALEVTGTLSTKSDVSLGVMPVHETEGTLKFARADGTNRVHNIKVYNSSTQASNYMKFQIHAGGASAGALTDNVLYLRGDGNVGIGTASPGYKLDVNGTVNTGALTATTGTFSSNVMVGGTTAYGPFTTSGGGLHDGDGIYSSKTCATLSVGRGGGGTYNQDQGTGAILEFRHSGDYRYATIESVSENTFSSDIGLRFKTVDTDAGPQERMRIDAHGNVGIGTTSPLSILHVRGTGQTSTTSFDTSQTLGASIFAESSDSTVGSGGSLVLGTQQGKFAVIKAGILDGASNTMGNLHFMTRNATADATLTNRMTITNTGNVGIGTTSPGNKLHIEGASSDLLYLKKSTNTGGVGMVFTDMVPDSQYGYLRFHHANDESFGTSACFRFSTTEASDAVAIGGTLLIGVDGKDDGYMTNVTGSGRKNLFIQTTFGGNTSQNYGWWIGAQNQAPSATDNDLYFGVVRNGTLTLAGTILDQNNAPMNFTGQHRTFVKDVPIQQLEDKEGLIVSADQNEFIRMSGGIVRGNEAITTNESLPIVSFSTKSNDKKCFGVVSTTEDPENRVEVYGNFASNMHKELGDTRVYINSVGEGAIWVTNINGPLESGDYITTSNVTGYGQRQDDDILHNYTVAKITMDCDFNPVTQPVHQIKKELTHVDYWIDYATSEIKQGEYETLPENEREIHEDKYYKIYKREIQKTNPENDRYVHEVREELVNVLDEHGQLQWEDHPTETEKAYKIRYLDALGAQTDEANAVHRAAFVGCTYHCG